MGKKKRIMMISKMKFHFKQNGKTYVSDWLHNSHCHCTWDFFFYFLCCCCSRGHKKKKNMCVMTSNKTKKKCQIILIQCCEKRSVFWCWIHLSHVHLMDSTLGVHQRH